MERIQVYYYGFMKVDSSLPRRYGSEFGTVLVKNPRIISPKASIQNTCSVLHILFLLCWLVTSGVSNMN